MTAADIYVIITDHSALRNGKLRVQRNLRIFLYTHLKNPFISFRGNFGHFPHTDTGITHFISFFDPLYTGKGCCHAEIIPVKPIFRTDKKKHRHGGNQNNERHHAGFYFFCHNPPPS